MAERPRFIQKGENKNTPNLPEKKVEINNGLPQKTKEALRKDGKIIFQIKPLSIKELIASGYNIKWITDDEMRKRNNKPNIDMDEKALFGEVAIDPKNLFLNRPYDEGTGERAEPGPNGLIITKNFLTDKEAVDNYSKEVSGKYAGTKAIIGNPATWAQIIYEFEKTGKRLIDTNSRYQFIGAESQNVKWDPHFNGDGEGIIIGHPLFEGVENLFSNTKAIHILDWGGETKEYHTKELKAEEKRLIGIAPLIVPA